MKYSKEIYFDICEVKYNFDKIENEKVILLTKYCVYKTKIPFIFNFRIITQNINDWIFKKLTIYFYDCYKKKVYLGETTIRLNELFMTDDKMYFQDFKTKEGYLSLDFVFLPRSSTGVCISDNPDIRGKVKMKYRIIEKNFVENNVSGEMNFINNFFRKKILDTSFSFIDSVITNYHDIFNTERINKTWLLLGFVILNDYYNNIYTGCEKDCDGINCVNNYCQSEFTDINKLLASKMIVSVRESVAPYLAHPVLWFLNKARNNVTEEDPVIKMLLENILVDKERIIKFSKLTEKTPCFVAFFKECDIFGNDEEIAVISFRGTYGINDTVIDLHCQYEEFEDGFVHSGFYHLSSSFIQNEWPCLRKACKEKKVRKVLIIGYSLGAALASVTNYMLSASEKDFEFKTIGFGCPPVFSESIVLKAKVDIKIFTYSLDIISRLSYGSIKDLIFLLNALYDRYSFFGNREKTTVEINKIRRYIKNTKINPKLYLIGNLYNIQKFDNTYQIKKVHYKYYEEVPFCSTAGLNHFIHHILHAFELAECDASPK